MFEIFILKFVIKKLVFFKSWWKLEIIVLYVLYNFKEENVKIVSNLIKEYW